MDVPVGSIVHLNGMVIFIKTLAMDPRKTQLVALRKPMISRFFGRPNLVKYTLPIAENKCLVLKTFAVYVI